jgi:hypothetical protein
VRIAQRDNVARAVMSVDLGKAVLERFDIQPVRRIGPPLQRARCHIQEPIGIRQGPA